MNHTHEYKYYHAHRHAHSEFTPPRDVGNIHVIAKLTISKHDGGHYHIFAQTHDHGEGGAAPHFHKARQFHPGDDAVKHHAVAEHEKENGGATLISS